MVDNSDTEAGKRIRIIIIAYALPPKKISTFITPSLVCHAQLHGIDLSPVDPRKPLDSQLPFHCLIHKLYDDHWKTELLDFHREHPEIPIVDLPSKIERLHNRETMLEFIKDLTLPDPSPSLGIPHQILLNDDDIVSSSLRFPLIAKPLIADGGPDSHKLSLVINFNGLLKVKKIAPLILQKFVNHGGVLFKIYVAGTHIKCVKRKSLPDFQISNFPSELVEEGVVPLSQASNLPSTTKLSEQEADGDMPPADFVNNLAAAVREATQLRLFNLDLIRDGSDVSGNKYLVVDINYFPGYAKLPEYEAMITDFFLDVVHKDAIT